MNVFFFFFSSRRRHTRSLCDWSSDVCSSDLLELPHMLDQGTKRVPKAFDIGKQDRLAVTAELNPGHLLDDFFECSDPAGHCHESVRHLEHLALTLVHVARDDQVVGAAHCMFARDQKFGNDAGHFAAVIEDGFGKCAHHSDGPSAEDEADAVFSKDCTESTGAVDKGRISARPRAAIKADFSDFAGFFASVHSYACALHLRHRQGGWKTPEISARGD